MAKVDRSRGGSRGVYKVLPVGSTGVCAMEECVLDRNSFVEGRLLMGGEVDGGEQRL